MVKFTEIINSSIEWTGTVLFRPFNPKKWLILTFTALLAGSLTGGGCNLNFGDHYRERAKKAEASEASQVPLKQDKEKQFPKIVKEILNQAFLKLKNPAVRTAIIIIIPIILAFFVTMMWLWSCFCFVFLENVVKNDASIKLPFKENKGLGKSLFLFQLSITTIFLLLSIGFVAVCIYILIKIVPFDKLTVIGFMKIFLVCLPFILAFLLIIIIFGIVALIVNDFILVAMYKDKIKIMQAWPKIIAILKTNKSNLVKYILLKIVLSICSSIICGILSVVSFVGLLLPIGIVGVFFYIIYLIVPQVLHIFYFIILALIAVPTLIFLIYCIMCLCLPFAVFFRTLSVKFIGRLEPRYNLFSFGT